MAIFPWIVAVLGAGFVLVSFIGMINPSSGMGTGVGGLALGALMTVWGWRGIQRGKADKASRPGEPQPAATPSSISEERLMVGNSQPSVHPVTRKSRNSHGYEIVYPDGRVHPANQDWNGRVVKPSTNSMQPTSEDEAGDSIRFAVLNTLPIDPMDLFWYGTKSGLGGPSQPVDVREYIDAGRKFRDDLPVAPLPPKREIGLDPASGKMMFVIRGRLMSYVSDGEVNAALKRSDDPESVTLERASELLAIRREKIGEVTRNAQTKKSELLAARGQTGATTVREVGIDPASGRMMSVMKDRFGIYLSDGQTNFDLGTVRDPEAINIQMATKLLDDQRQSDQRRTGI